MLQFRYYQGGLEAALQNRAALLTAPSTSPTLAFSYSDVSGLLFI